MALLEANIDELPLSENEVTTENYRSLTTFSPRPPKLIEKKSEESAKQLELLQIKDFFFSPLKGFFIRRKLTDQEDETLTFNDFEAKYGNNEEWMDYISVFVANLPPSIITLILEVHGKVLSQTLPPQSSNEGNSPPLSPNTQSSQSANPSHLNPPSQLNFYPNRTTHQAHQPPHQVNTTNLSSLR